MEDNRNDDLLEIQEAVASAQETNGLRWNIRRARNTDPTDVTPDMLLERERQETEHQSRITERFTAKQELDRKVRAERWLQKIPPEFHFATVADLPTDLRRLCQEWLSTPDREKPCFILTGPTGVGKTSVMYAVARELYFQREEFLLRKVERLQDEMRVSAANAGQTYENARTCRYLLLDDAGAEKRTAAMDEKFTAIFDHRWEWKLPVMITTNLPIEGIPGYFGERVASRLLHNPTIYKVEGEDRRML